jgi:hypothetical protein
VSSTPAGRYSAVARSAHRPLLATRRERAAALLQDDDRFLVGEAEGGARAGVEPQPARAELARSRIAALLQHLDAELPRLSEECVSEHMSLVR